MVGVQKLQSLPARCERHVAGCNLHESSERKHNGRQKCQSSERVEIRFFDVSVFLSLKTRLCIRTILHPCGQENRGAVLPFAAYRVASAVGPDFSAVAAGGKLCFSRISFMRFIVSG